MKTTTEKTITLEIYDPAMCCSTGVCGPEVDDTLVDFANTVKWLKEKGIEVKRFNLGQEPEVFKTQPEVLSRLKHNGSDILPIILINGSVFSEGKYPDRAELQEALGIDMNLTEQENVPADVIINEQLQELIALAAALASNCEPCLKFHYKKAVDLGLSTKTIAQTLQIAQQVKDTPAMNMVSLANKLLGVREQPSNGCAPGSGCC